MKKTILCILAGGLLLSACGQSYEDTKRKVRENRREQARQDSAALKVAVMPTIDCLPLFVAEQHHLFDSVEGGVRLKRFYAQMDCDTAFARGRVEGMVSDLVRTKCLERSGVDVRYVAATQGYWQLISNRNARIRQPRQMDDKMVAMTRFSATDMLSDLAIDSAKLDGDRVFRVQINDLRVRMQMLQNNEMDVLWLPEPLATMARNAKHPVVLDSRSLGVQLGVVAFRDQEMKREARARQLEKFLRVCRQACDSIASHGLRRYAGLIEANCGVGREVVDSLSDTSAFRWEKGPSRQVVERVEKWIDQRNGARHDKK